MSGHASVELLSLYVDADLLGADQRQLEEHLRSCPECRHRLAGLRRVVTRLESLPLAAPPGDLAARVRREARSLRNLRRWWEPPVLSRDLLAGPPLMHLFALVLALAAFIYLFSFGVARQAERPTRIVLPGAGAPPPPRPATTLPVEPMASRQLLGGVFHRIGGVWVEQGLAAREPDDSVRLWRTASVVADPELEVLLALEAPVRLRVGEQVVEIAFEPGGPAEGP